MSATTLPACKWIGGEKPTLLKQLEAAVPAIQSAAESGTRTADSLTTLIDWLHSKLVYVWIALAGTLFTFAKTGWRYAHRKHGSSGPAASSPGGSSGS